MQRQLRHNHEHNTDRSRGLAIASLWISDTAIIAMPLVLCIYLVLAYMALPQPVIGPEQPVKTRRREWPTRAQELDSPVWLLVISALTFAPVGEEALIRGIAYPALRKHWPPWAAAFLTASVFALLYGDIAQVAITVLLGIL